MKAKETISFSAIIKPTQAGIKFNGLDAGSEVTLVIPAVDAGNVARLIALAGNVFRVNIEPGEGDEKNQGKGTKKRLKIMTTMMIFQSKLHLKIQWMNS